MPEKGKIDSKQATFLMVNTILSTAILFVPAITARHAGQDAWLSALLATLFGLLAALLVAGLGLRFPEQTIFQYPEVILGRVPGKLVALLYVWWFLHMDAEVIREYGSFIVSAFMPETPLIVFHLAVVAMAAYAVRNGLEVIGRTNQVFFPLIVFSLLILFLLATQEMDTKRLLPVFDRGAVQILKGAVTPMSWFGELFTLAALIPCLNRPVEARRVAVTAVLLTGFFFTLTVFGVVLIFGPNVTAGWMFPTLNGARLIHLANFLERLESIVMVVWVTGGFVKISVFYWAAVLGSAQVAGLRDYRPLVLPVGAFLVMLSILVHRNILELVAFLGTVWPPYALTVFEVGIPLLLLAVASIRGLGREQR
ncbi:MAG: endospore germination permease [Peptococcaceae bacterium]|nr:endospore germination permease [Peptococcaceae bacterium]